MKRPLALVLMMLATAASATASATTTQALPAEHRADVSDVHARAREGEKTQWAPSGGFSALHARAVSRGESFEGPSAYGREAAESAVAEREWTYAGSNPTRYTDPDGRQGLEDLLRLATKPPLPNDLPVQRHTAELTRETAVAAPKLVTGYALGLPIGGALATACAALPAVCGWLAIGGALTSGQPTINGPIEAVNACVPGSPSSDAFACGLGIGTTEGGVATGAGLLVPKAGPALMSRIKDPLRFGETFDVALREASTDLTREMSVPSRASATTIPYGGSTGPVPTPSQAVDSTKLAPRVDVTSRFSFKRRNRGRVEMRYGDPEFHGLDVSVDAEGVAGFDIRAYGNPQTQGSGTDMMLSAMQRLRQEGVAVKRIRGFWVHGGDSVNARQYRANLVKGMSPEEAAANTWTGEFALGAGYTRVEIVSDTPSSTVVLFEPTE